MLNKGFDEYMNMVIIQAVEVKLAQGEQDEVRTELGRYTLGGLITKLTAF